MHKLVTKGHFWRWYPTPIVLGSSHTEYVGNWKEVDGKTPKIQRRRSIVEVRDTLGRVSSFGKILAPVIWSRVPETTLPTSYARRVNFSLCCWKRQTTIYMNVPELSRGLRQLGWTSCLTSAGRVTLASGTTFLHINALARLIGTTR